MERSYRMWVAVSVATIILVVAGFYVSLRRNKQATSPSPSPTASLLPTPTVIPTDTTPSPTSSPTATAQPTPTTPVNHSAQGDAAYKNSQYDKAIEEYKLALAQTNDPKELASLWNRIGNSYREINRTNDAIQSYDQALAHDDRLGDAYLNKAALLWKRGEKEPAKETLRTGIAKDATRKQDLQNTLDVYEALS